MRDYLKKLIQNKRTQYDNLNTSLIESDSKEERQAIGETMKALMTEIQEAEEQLAKLDAEDNDEGGENEENPQQEPGAEGRSSVPSFNPVASFGIPAGGNPAKSGQRSNEHPRATMEYRKAFMEYVQSGTMSAVLTRADSENVSTDLGVLMPETVVQDIIKGVEKVYGQLYSRVKKTNVKGGVKYPIGAFSATLVWGGTAGNDKEHGVSEKQKAGDVDSYVQFTYHIGEVRIAQSLLQTVVTVEVFESELVKALIEAYVKGMDTAILNGSGVNQPTGIFTDTAEGLKRIPAANIIEFSEADMADWKQWKKKLFAKIPLSMRGLSPQFAMTANTYESNIETLEDDQGRPVAREIYNPVNGAETARFSGKEVVFIEEGTSIKNFDDAAAGEYFGIYWVPEKGYAINTNLRFGYKKYFDENTNQWITKGLVIVDGKILDAKYIYLLKKA